MGLETVSFADFFRDNASVTARSEEVVRKLADRGAGELAHTLIRLTGEENSPVTPDLARDITRAQFLRLSKELRAKREAGLLNDTKTSSEDIAMRGVKMVVAPENDFEGFMSYVGQFIGGEPPKGSKVEVFDEGSRQEYLGLDFGNSRFRVLDVPTPCIGVYGYLDTVDFNFERTVPLVFPLSQVIRLETTGGDLWQSPNHTPAGLAIALARG